MSAIRTLLARLRSAFRGHDLDRLDEEIEDHAALLTAEYLRRGLPQEEAETAARRDVGNIVALREQYREQNGFPLIENRWLDLKFAIRTLRRSRIFAIACMGTLAIGLASMSAVLCVVDTIFWKPLPYPKAQELVALKQIDPRGGEWIFSEPALLDLEGDSASFESVAAFRLTTVAMAGSGDAETVRASAVTPECFKMFGTHFAAGHAFQSEHAGVVISPALWRRKWQSDPAILGRAITVDGASYTISGVADSPQDLLPGAQLLFPLEPKGTESRTAHEIEAVARLKEGVTMGQAQAALDAIASRISRENANTSGGWGMRVIPLDTYIVGPRTRRVVWMMLGAVGLLWVLACTNVAALRMSRSIARGHEMSTRRALGASHSRLFAQAFTENCVLAIGAAAAGLAIAFYAIEAVKLFGSESLPRLAQVRLDARTGEIALGCLLVSTFVFTLFSLRIPQLQSTREVSRQDRGRDALIVMQIALAGVLLFSASLLFHSFLHLQAVNPGFDPDRILDVRINLPTQTYNDQHRVEFLREVTQSLQRIPSVQSAGATNVTPFSGEGTANRFRLEGESGSAEFRSADWRAVTPGFFATLGVPLKRGRLFTDRDAQGASEVVILSDSMARQFWPNQDPIGERLLWGRSGSPKTIVGIVGDLRDRAVDMRPEPTMFRPYAQLSDAPMTLVVRTRGDPANAVADIRQSIHSLDRNVALQIQPLRDAMSDSILRPRTTLLIMAVFAALAMLTATFGLYGSISYRVNQRQGEIGIRLALGAAPRTVSWSVQKRCLTLVGIGLLIGMPIGYGLSTLLTSLLYETEPTQVTAYVAVVAVFAAIGLVASYGPARRAARMDPVAAIRYE